MRPPRRNLPCLGWRWLPSQTPDSALTEPEDPNDPGPAQPRDRAQTSKIEVVGAFEGVFQRATRRFIEAFARTNAAAHPSLVSGRDPPDLAAISAPFLPPSRGQHPTPGPSPCLQDHAPVRQSRRPPSNWTAPQPGRADGERLPERRPPVPVACLRQTRLRGPERARTATAHEATRLDARRDSVLDLDLGLADPSSGPRQHTRHHPTTTFRNDESMVWPSAQPQLTPSHHAVLPCYDSWPHSPHCPVS